MGTLTRLIGYFSLIIGSPSPNISVCRDKAQFLSRCNSYPATVTPAGSNWSRRGGNETSKASSVEGP